ncbi:hypothetical protein Q5424_13130 [Conexibacter sp. JD483]|uniref:hypothetical protein n=1 Tax=unclassified Conexibacter TaxID=2627773 RepID=UPI0027193524|nr:MULTISPECIES: hypothetical protein [unclassified Conexibacter]MDO8188096.1 hypothetical protein [Conexibacter sp. CPCC 205706]MDO8196908.1 hypothetical protein [Conexibacter sp. CPCC 205762]MDR9370037.1 hypothetical protein [Conexibacter sp. JD483]
MPQPTRHVLVVTAPAATPAALRRSLLARVARGPAEFTLLVAGDDLAARGWLLEAVELLRASGLDVVGQLGPADPDRAVAETWDPREHDELLAPSPLP